MQPTGRERNPLTMRHSVCEQTQWPTFQRSGWRARARPSSSAGCLGLAGCSTAACVSGGGGGGGGCPQWAGPLALTYVNSTGVWAARDNAYVINPHVAVAPRLARPTLTLRFHTGALGLSLFGWRSLRPLQSISLHLSFSSPPLACFSSPPVSPALPHPCCPRLSSLSHCPSPRLCPPTLSLDPLSCPPPNPKSLNPPPLLSHQPPLHRYPHPPAILQASGARLQAFRESLDLLGSG